MCGGCLGGPGRIWGAVCVGSAQQCGAAVGGGQSSAAVCCVRACLEDGAELLRTPAHISVFGGSRLAPLYTGMGSSCPTAAGIWWFEPRGRQPPRRQWQEGGCLQGGSRARLL